MPKYYTNSVPDWLLLLEKIQGDLNPFGFTVEEILEEGIDPFGEDRTDKIRRQLVRLSLSLMAKKGIVVVPDEGHEEYSLTNHGRALDVSRLMEAY